MRLHGCVLAESQGTPTLAVLARVGSSRSSEPSVRYCDPPPVEGAGRGAWVAAGGVGVLRGAVVVVAPEPVVVAGGLFAVVEVSGPRANTNTSSNANTTPPAIQPHMAFD